MRDYILSVISVAFCGALVNAIAPWGEGKKLKKALSLIVSLLLIVSVAKPIISFVNSADGYDIGALASGIYSSKENYDKYWQKTLVEVTDESARTYVYELMLSEFGLSDDDFSLECKISQGGDVISLDSIKITLRSTGIFVNPRRIESFIGEKFGCECEVTEEWG
ncbi:MAG: hypothetical protein E7671_01970 [Ruminococcaceae bacterium]|nr:hypothetical protein [Oscillospiraceae bacterium]